MKYKVWQHGANGALEHVVIETDEDYTRLMAHSHIHSAEPIVENKEEGYGYVKPAKKIKK